jgi:divalent metal cation (Fe/Co/Zn/Cd) transporter
VGFLCGAVALFGFGMYILLDAVLKLIQAEHPSIPTAHIFGTNVWMGWIMLAVLLYSVIPPMILGRMKVPLAAELHDKALHVSATINKGDWLSGIAGAAGMIGIAYGLWWADAAAAAFISIEIVKDGYENLRNSVAQLMNKRPSDVENAEKDPAIDRLQQALERLDWVAGAKVRLREDGDVLTGEAFVQPREGGDLLPHLDEARRVATSVDWRLHDVNIVPVRKIG